MGNTYDKTNVITIKKIVACQFLLFLMIKISGFLDGLKFVIRSGQVSGKS